MLLSSPKGQLLRGFLQFVGSNIHREVFVLMRSARIYFVRVSCSLLARESAPVLVRACRRRCEQYSDMQTSENNFKPAGAD